jgi:hypothetical protein
MLSLDANRWVSEVSSGYAGFRCTECATWKYASEFLLCKCDKESQFVISGKEHGEPVYWSNELGWIDDVTEATTFPKGILGEPLPVGSEGVLELTLTGEHVAFYSCHPSRGRGQ